MHPLYTPDNTTAAYELNRSVALFGTDEFPSAAKRLSELKAVAESDGVRILEHHIAAANVIQLLVSSKPHIAPSQIVRSLKGRWQYLIRDTNPKAFRRRNICGGFARIGLVTDHFHILLTTNVTESPDSVALCLMNNLVYVQQMKPVLRFSYYVGTFGDYDGSAIRKILRS